MNQNFSSLLTRHVALKLQKPFHTTCKRLATHYDTLKLQKSCSRKEIRDSFLKLSKEYHPDKNKNPSAHKEFVKIQEAYNVLSKPHLRASYDLGLSSPFQARYGSTGTTYTYYRPSAGPHQRSGPYKTYSYGRNPWEDSSFYNNTYKSYSYADPNNDSYYGIKGIKRQSNGTVLIGVVIFGLIMFVLEMLAFRYTFSRQQELMNERTMATQKILNEIKERAEKNGKDTQMEIHKKQFEEKEKNREERRLRTLRER